MEGCFMFQWEGGGVAFQMGGAPWGGASALVGEGGVEKHRKMGGRSI